MVPETTQARPRRRRRVVSPICRHRRSRTEWRMVNGAWKTPLVPSVRAAGINANDGRKSRACEKFCGLCTCPHQRASPRPSRQPRSEHRNSLPSAGRWIPPARRGASHGRRARTGSWCRWRSSAAGAVQRSPLADQRTARSEDPGRADQGVDRSGRLPPGGQPTADEQKRGATDLPAPPVVGTQGSGKRLRIEALPSVTSAPSRAGRQTSLPEPGVVRRLADTGFGHRLPYPTAAGLAALAQWLGDHRDSGTGTGAHQLLRRARPRTPAVPVRSDNGLVSISRLYTRLVHAMACGRNSSHRPVHSKTAWSACHPHAEVAVLRIGIAPKLGSVIVDWTQFHIHRRLHQALCMKTLVEACSSAT